MSIRLRLQPLPLFLSTPSARRATFRLAILWQRLAYFYPRPPRGGRHRGDSCFDASVKISIHALREEGDSMYLFLRVARRYFYPRPPRGGRRSAAFSGQQTGAISIHALREEGDLFALVISGIYAQFLSTPSARRATVSLFYRASFRADFYPRPPRGGRLTSDG